MFILCSPKICINLVGDETEVLLGNAKVVFANHRRARETQQRLYRGYVNDEDGLFSRVRPLTFLVSQHI